MALAFLWWVGECEWVGVCVGVYAGVRFRKTAPLAVVRPGGVEQKWGVTTMTVRAAVT